MKESEINAAIAEACGWRFDPTTPNQDMKAVAVMCWIRPGNADWQTEKLPNYCGDLNAIAQAEKTLSEADRLELIYALWRALKPGNHSFLTSSGLDEFDAFELLHATAQQRAEAFLKVITNRQENKKERG